MVSSHDEVEWRVPGFKADSWLTAIVFAQATPHVPRGPFVGHSSLWHSRLVQEFAVGCRRAPKGGSPVPIMITDECMNCGACVQSCPNGGISEGQDKVVIDGTLCTECVGFFSTEQCVLVCPVSDACVPDPDNVEPEAVLFERAKKIHAGSTRPPTLSSRTSHFQRSESRKWRQRFFRSRVSSLQDLPEVEDA